MAHKGRQCEQEESVSGDRNSGQFTDSVSTGTRCHAILIDGVHSIAMALGHSWKGSITTEEGTKTGILCPLREDGAATNTLAP